MRYTWKKALAAMLSVALMATLLAAPAAGAAEGAEGPVLAADGGSFTYRGESVTLGPKAIYVDGRLSAQEAAKSEYVFTSFNEAVAHLTDGTEEEPMDLYLAPYVYWLHDPQAPEATGMDGVNQMVIACENLHITGLAEDPQDVVVAANFGHDIGFSGGNYTMFSITGDGLTLKNMTFGDYCNVDLVYPADPSLNVPARDPQNITQGQIGVYEGDKLFAENVRFISRLNMMPFNNAKRALYVNCHMECTDDALNGPATGVYLGCDFDFYSSKPWYSSGGGVVLLDCTMRLFPQTPDAQSLTQYLTKTGGSFTVVDCSFESGVPSTAIGWSDVFDETYKSYYANVDLNGSPIAFTAGARPDAGVDLAGKDALKAFKLDDGTYNVYNLLRGGDDWDPLGQKAAVTAAGAADLPTSMEAYAVTGETTARRAAMVSGGESGVLQLGCRIVGPQSTDYNAAADVTWSVKEADKQYVELTPNADGTCQVEGINTSEEAALVVVTARDASGLEAAVALDVHPSILPTPVFDQAPALVLKDGKASVTYTYTPESIDDRPDNARIVWSVCDDAQGTDSIPVAVGRGDTPLHTIPLTPAMVGKHLMAAVEPKHRRSNYGAAVTAVSAAPVAAQDVPASDGALKVDVATFPVDTQGQVIPGFWTVDSYKPADTEPDGAFSGGDWKADGTSGWSYGAGVKNGTKGVTGIFTGARGARLMYTPLEKLDREMDLTVTLAPGKTAGQGFGSANQYMDFMVKYDPANHTGWGLRIYRKSGSSCCFALVGHTADGGCTLLTAPVESGIFLTMATVHVWTLNDELHATVSSTNTDAMKDSGPVELTAPVPELRTATESGVELNHTGTVGDNAVYLTEIQAQWPERGTTAATPDKVIPVKGADGELLGEVRLSAVIPALETRFADVPAGHWAEQAINDMAALGVVKGVGEDTFDLVSPVTRGSVATILFRLSGGKAGLKSTFTDVPEGAWYADGVAWAAKAGVVNGYDSGAFGPDDPITREQLAVMVARYLRLLGADTAADVAELSAFDDAAAVNSWAADSLAWCVKNGVVKGRDGNILAPTATVTRAEAAVMLDRAIGLLK